MLLVTTTYRPVCFCVWQQCFLQKCDADNWGLLCLAFLSVCVQSLIISDSALWKRAPLWDFGFSVADAANCGDKWGIYVHPCLNVFTIQSFY